MNAAAITEFSPLRRHLASRASSTTEGVRTPMMELASTLNNTIPLGRGDPDLPMPIHIVRAAKETRDRGVTHYTHPAGDLALRHAIAGHIKATIRVRRWIPDAAVTGGSARSPVI